MMESPRENFGNDVFFMERGLLLEEIQGLIDDICRTEVIPPEKIWEFTEFGYRELLIEVTHSSDLQSIFDLAVESAAQYPDDHRMRHLRDLLKLRMTMQSSDSALLELGRNESCRTWHDDEHCVHAVPETIAGVPCYTAKAIFQGVLQWDQRTWPNSDEDKKSALHRQTLSQLLAADKPPHLLLPECIAYVEDRTAMSSVEWVMTMPHGSRESTNLVSLHQLLSRAQERPTMDLRVALALKLAVSPRDILAVGWIQGATQSGHILFSYEQSSLLPDAGQRMGALPGSDLGKPIWLCFDYGRSYDDSVISWKMHDRTWDPYRWPTQQGRPPEAGTARKVHDIYAFGLLLLEILHWEPLHKLVRLKSGPSASEARNVRIRGELLGKEPTSRLGGQNPVSKLEADFPMYGFAVRSAIVAYGDEGMGVEEDIDESSIGIALFINRAFQQSVVERLQESLFSSDQKGVVMSSLFALS
ncbi:hypothetical protein LTR53_007651 [Teratosphaeriaceae sp. CCFEE 6253]|nr:hypothetical protein LTR53_007651 [Teratosphaeriaceae sp. CCFEE 6253]